MRDYRYDHVHLRSPDPDATARFFETMFGAEVARGIYPPGTLYPGQQRITMRLGGQTVLIAPPHAHAAVNAFEGESGWASIALATHMRRICPMRAARSFAAPRTISKSCNGHG